VIEALCYRTEVKEKKSYKLVKIRRKRRGLTKRNINENNNENKRGQKIRV
jgi:hypothetical protein